MPEGMRYPTSPKRRLGVMDTRRESAALTVLALLLATVLCTNVYFVDAQTERHIGDTADAIVAQEVPGSNEATAFKQLPSGSGPGNRFVHGPELLARLRADPAAAQAVATASGVTVSQIESDGAIDEDLALDVRTNELAYLCKGLMYSPKDAATIAEELQAGQSADRSNDDVSVQAIQVDQPDPSTDQAFMLHSLPGSNRLIYLDFDGHVSCVGWTRGWCSP